eukprot:3812840-Rhodomonas_salina.1
MPGTDTVKAYGFTPMLTDDSVLRICYVMTGRYLIACSGIARLCPSMLPGTLVTDEAYPQRVAINLVDRMLEE